MERITGGYLCGSVRYEANTKPLMTRACWRHTCQYFAADKATVNAPSFPSSSLGMPRERKSQSNYR